MINVIQYMERDGKYENEMLWRFLLGCTGLEEITFGPYFSFDGDGSVPRDELRFKMSSSTDVEGWDGYWYNADTGVAYAPSEIPEEFAATYVAVNPNVTGE